MCCKIVTRGKHVHLGKFKLEFARLFALQLRDMQDMTTKKLASVVVKHHKLQCR